MTAIPEWFWYTWRIVTLLIFALSVGQLPGSDLATFEARAAEFDAREARLNNHIDPEEQATAALEWLQALRRVLETIPDAAAESAYKPWLQTHANLLVHDEIGTAWLIRYSLLEEMHSRHGKSAAADEIAWIAVLNGLGGECEGYAPCYVHRLNTLYGTYFRRHSRGVHRMEAFTRLNQTLSIVLDGPLRSPIQEELFSVANDCGDLLKSARPLEAAIAGADPTLETTQLIDRLMSVCPKP